MNLEDDVVITSKNFVRETFSYVQQREEIVTIGLVSNFPTICQLVDSIGVTI